MQIIATLPVIMTGQAKFLESDRADAIWEELCDNFNVDQPFTIDEAVARSTFLKPYAKGTQRTYMTLVIRAILADYAARPDDYDRIEPIRRVNGTARPYLYSL
jgi:hypothetical protein